MKAVLTIALNDLRLLLRSKSGYFWLFGSPLLFAFFMGFANRGPGSPANPRPPVRIENRDSGFMSELFMAELGTQGLTIETNESTDADRTIRIPAGFTDAILNKSPARLEMARRKGSREEAGSMVELKLARALVAMNSHLIEQAGTGTDPARESLRAVMDRANPVQLRATFGTRKPMPAGHQQSIPGVMVMFVLMNLLIFGGATVADERREGVLRRLLVQPLTRAELVFGKVTGLLLLGAVQVIVLLLIGRFLMGLDFAGNLFGVLATMAVYSWMAAACGVLIGSLLAREDKVVAVAVLASMVMAAMGGCWWPLEIVPDNVRTLGHLFPTAWAMDAMHQLISFGGGFSDVWQELLVLAGFGAAGTYAAIRFFRA
jgi:ABC-type multidrug transport system permease subunit